MAFLAHVLVGFFLALLFSRLFRLRAWRPAALLIAVLLVVLCDVVYRLVASIELAISPTAFLLPDLLGAMLAVSAEALSFYKPKV